METKPTHEQAQLHLQVYEMRREAKLRQGREWFFKNYFVEKLEDSMRIAAPGTEGRSAIHDGDHLLGASRAPPITDCFTRTFSSRPAANFSASGSE